MISIKTIWETIGIIILVGFIILLARNVWVLKKEMRIVSGYLSACVQKKICPTPQQLAPTPTPTTETQPSTGE